MKGLDKLDEKILSILDWQGRMPINLIAKKVGSNKDVVSYRIKHLGKKGIITRYFPILDMFKLGYHTSRLYFDLEELAQEQEKKLVDFLDKEIKAGLIFRMDYPYKWGIVVWVKSIYDVEKIMVKIKQYLGKDLIRYNHTLFNMFRQYPKDYLFGNGFHSTYYSLEPQEPLSYDKDDFRILQILAENARATTVEMNHKLGIPQTTISNKIKMLEKKKIILGYRAEINFVALGYMNYFLEIYLEDNHNLKEIEYWADHHKNVVWLQKIIGTCDIEIEVEVKDRVALEIVLNELRHLFRNIRKIVFWSQEYRKLTFLP